MSQQQGNIDSNSKSLFQELCLAYLITVSTLDFFYKQLRILSRTRVA